MEAEKPKKYCVTIKQLEPLQQHSFQTSPINKELYENNVRVKKYNGGFIQPSKNSTRMRCVISKCIVKLQNKGIDVILFEKSKQST